jgi:hypothetical protein
MSFIVPNLNHSHLAVVASEDENLWFDAKTEDYINFFVIPCMSMEMRNTILSDDYSNDIHLAVRRAMINISHNLHISVSWGNGSFNENWMKDPKTDRFIEWPKNIEYCLLSPSRPIGEPDEIERLKVFSALDLALLYRNLVHEN